MFSEITFLKASVIGDKCQIFTTVLDVTCCVNYAVMAAISCLRVCNLQFAHKFLVVNLLCRVSMTGLGQAKASVSLGLVGF